MPDQQEADDHRRDQEPTMFGCRVVLMMVVAVTMLPTLFVAVVVATCHDLVEPHRRGVVFAMHALRSRPGRKTCLLQLNQVFLIPGAFRVTDPDRIVKPLTIGKRVSSMPQEISRRREPDRPSPALRTSCPTTSPATT